MVQKIDLYSIDLQPSWKPYAEALGCKFVAPWDVSKETADSLLGACGGKPIDVSLFKTQNPPTAPRHLLPDDLLHRRPCVSVVMTSKRLGTADLFATFLKRGYAAAMLISERT